VGGTQEVPDEEGTDIQQQEGTTHVDGNHAVHQNESAEQDMRLESEDTMATNPSMEVGLDFMREEMEEGGVLHNTGQIEMTFHVENRADDDMGDEDDDMGDDGDEDEDEDEDEGEDEDEDIAEDGAGMMSLADTDVEDHDDTGLGDDYNDEMIDEEDDDFHENRVIEVRWREALDGLDHLQVLGQPGASGGLIDVAAEPFEGVNVDDLFGLRRPLGFDRRRQSGRSSFERSVTEVNGFQHPLLLRPSQSGDLVSMWSSGGHSSRDLEALSSGSFDVAHFYIDAPVLPYEHVPSSIFVDRSGSAAPPPLSDYSVGMDSLHTQGRRGPGDGRWTDDGQPQAGAQAAAIAQAIEEQFLSQLCSVPATNVPTERQFQNSGVQENQPSDPLSNDGQVVVDGDNTSNQQLEVHQENGNEDTRYQPNPTVETVPCNEQVDPRPSFSGAGEGPQVDEPMLVQPISLNSTPNGLDNMEIGDGDGTACDQVETMPELANSSAEQHAALHYEGVPEVPASLNEVPIQAVGSAIGGLSDNPLLVDSVSAMPNVDHVNADVEMNGADADGNQLEQSTLASERGADEPSSRQETLVARDAAQADQTGLDNGAPATNAIDPTFLEALPEDLRAEVLASQQAQSVQPPTYAPPSVDDIDPEFLAALPPDIQAEVLAQQRAQRIAQQAEGQPVDMDNASIIATFPADLREEVCAF
jgi:E3 ubiquitin-protein ligase HUWE1